MVEDLLSPIEMTNSDLRVEQLFFSVPFFNSSKTSSSQKNQDYTGEMLTSWWLDSPLKFYSIITILVTV
jgi:hypothetical protein